MMGDIWLYLEDSYITNLNLSNENMFFAPLLASWNSVTFKSVPAKQNPR